MEQEDMKIKYYEMITTSSMFTKVQADLMRRKWVEMMVQRVIAAKDIVKSEGDEKLPKVAKEALEKYDVAEINERHRLVLKSKDSGAQKVIVPLESSFEFVLKAHQSTEHGTITEMIKWLHEANHVVSTICMPVIRKVCDICLSAKDKTPNPALYKMYSTLALVNILDMTLQPDKSFSYLLVYQDLNTKFVQLRAMAEFDVLAEITTELFKIFCDFSPPDCIVVELKMKDLFERVLDRLKYVFETKISLKTSEERDAVTPEVESRLLKWMKHHECGNWAMGCHIVQWEINNTRMSPRTPFEKFFGDNSVLTQDSDENELGEAESSNASCGDTTEHLTEGNDKVTNDVDPKDTDQKDFEPQIKIFKITSKGKSITKEPASNAKPISRSCVSDVIEIESESESEQEKDNKTHTCCTCNAEMTTEVYFCCVCGESLHLYCGARRQGPNGVVENICYLCLNAVKL